MRSILTRLMLFTWLVRLSIVYWGLSVTRTAISLYFKMQLTMLTAILSINVYTNPRILGIGTIDPETIGGEKKFEITQPKTAKLVE